MNVFNDIFKDRFVINLDRRLDRLNEVNLEFEKHKIYNVKRWSAFDGINLDNTQYLKRGEIGCTRSHSSLMQYCLDSNIEQVLIFEDDVIFYPNVIEIFNHLYNEIPNDWEMIYLGGNHRGPLTQITNHIYRMSHSYAMHAYIIKKSAMEWIIKECKLETRINDVVAAEYHAVAPCYTFLPVLAWQKANFSDLQEGFRNYDNLLKIGV